MTGWHGGMKSWPSTPIPAQMTPKVAPHREFTERQLRNTPNCVTALWPWFSPCPVYFLPLLQMLSPAHQDLSQSASWEIQHAGGKQGNTKLQHNLYQSDFRSGAHGEPGMLMVFMRMPGRPWSQAPQDEHTEGGTSIFTSFFQLRRRRVLDSNPKPACSWSFSHSRVPFKCLSRNLVHRNKWSGLNHTWVLWC